MSLPDVVQSALGEESAAARVNLGGEDVLLVTPTRTLVYRAEGLLSDETVEEYPHGAERIEVSEGRRKSKITLDYGLDGERTFAVPTKQLDQVLHPVLAGVLNAAGITDSGETVKQTFRFSELTVVVTSARVVRHIGEAVWDEDYDEYLFADVTDLAFEEGSVATSVVITLDGRQERFKAPNDSARALREGLVAAVCAYHGVDDLDAFRAMSAPADDEDDESEPEDSNVSFGDGPAPLGTNDDETESAEGEVTARTVPDAHEPEQAAESDDEGFEGSGFQTAGVVDDPAVARELATLREEVERQNEELERQRETIERLIEELRQGR
ncbi:MAG: hypothetical protein ABEJ82_05030 [Haloplanus sp.]